MSSTSVTSSPGSLNQNQQQQQSQQGQTAPLFRLPSNLPPIENGEVIQMDIETYRALMQDLQNFKTILHKLASSLREPPSGQETGQVSDQPSDLLSSFYQVCKLLYPFFNRFICLNVSLVYQHMGLDAPLDRCDQSTQTTSED